MVVNADSVSQLTTVQRCSSNASCINGADPLIDEGDASSDVSMVRLVDSQISGQKTLILEGVDLLIDQNMSYLDDNSVLAIVSKVSRDGKGGNIYIDKDVTNINALIFIDGALINVKSMGDGYVMLNSHDDIEDLRRQLHFYGSISSSNTR